MRQVLSTYDGDLRDPLWWPQERPVPMRVARGPLGIPLRRCRGLRSCVESVPEPEHSSPVLTWIFVDKLMSLLFNMLSRLVITFLPRSKHLLILWLQSPSAVILEPPKIKPATVQSSNAITLGWISLQVLMCIRKVAWNERQVSTICGTPPHSSTK